MNEFYVYVHRRASDNLPFYVGKGKDKRAWNFHARSKFWNNTKAKHGVIVEIVFEDLSEEEAFQCEKDTILEFRYFGYPLVNLTDGGEGVSGYVQTEEHRKRLGQIRSNSQKWREGNHRAALKLKDRPLTVEHRQNISKGLTGIKRSEDTRKKMSESKKNSASAQRHIKLLSIQQRDITVYCFYSKNEVFLGTREDLAQKTGMPKNKIAKLFMKKGTRAMVGGWTLDPNYWNKR